MSKPLVKRFREAEIAVRAAALAYHTLLGIIPALGLLFWYLKAIGVTRQWRGQVKTFLLQHLNVNTGPEVIQLFDRLTTNVVGKTWGWIGMLIFFYTSLSLIKKLGDSIDTILDTSHAEAELKMGFVKLFLRRGLVLTALPVALIISVFVSSWIREDSILRMIFRFENAGTYLALPIPLILDIIALSMVYHLIPKNGAPWREALRAAVIVGPIFEIAKVAAGFVSRHAIATQKIYGAFAAVPLFIVWVHIAWMILLGGTLLIRTRRLR